MDPPFLEYSHGTMQGDQPGYSEPWTIHTFYAASRKSEPWNGLFQTPSPNDQDGQYISPGQFSQEQNFSDYRSAASPSVCSSQLPGDSGYGSSRHTYSIASASIHGDDSAVDLNIGQALGECQLNPHEHALTGRLNARAPGGKYSCGECNLTMKSQGEHRYVPHMWLV